MSVGEKPPSKIPCQTKLADKKVIFVISRMSRLKSTILEVTRKSRSRKTARSGNLRLDHRDRRNRPRDRPPSRARRSKTPRRRTPPRRSETPRRKTPPRSKSPPDESDIDISSDDGQSPTWSPGSYTPRLVIDESSPAPVAPPKENRPPPPPPPKKVEAPREPRPDEIEVTRAVAESDPESDDDEIPAIIAEYLAKEERRKRRAARRAHLRRKKINAKILGSAINGQDVRLIQRTPEAALECHRRIIQLLKLIKHHGTKNRLHSRVFWSTEKSHPLRTLMKKLSVGEYMSLYHNFVSSLDQSYAAKKNKLDAAKNNTRQ